MVIEEIGDDQTVCRLIDNRMQPEPSRLIFELFFPFERANPESLVWTRYASVPDGVHAAGLAWQRMVRERRPGMAYLGFRAAGVGILRAAKTKAGHGFSVTHDPVPDQFHAAIQLVPSDPARKIPSPEKVECRLLLNEKFAALTAYQAGDEAK